MCVNGFQVGDIVARKSYGGDVFFKIVNIASDGNGNPIYHLRGVLYRISADATSDDLIKHNPRTAYAHMQQYIAGVKRQVSRYSATRGMSFLNRITSRPGRILHIDSSSELLETCMEHYSEQRLRVTSMVADESRQPYMIRKALEQVRPDILVITGHDSLKKGAVRINSMDSYSNSKYYVQSVLEARRYEPDMNRLSIFAGACQSYFEAIMDAGANFASSPGRILINGLDPGIVSERIALTDVRTMVTPEEIARLTVSGEKGIGGIKTRGHLTWI